MRHQSTAYDTPWRRNYELGQFFCWVFTAMVAFGIAVYANYTHGWLDTRFVLLAAIFGVAVALAAVKYREAKNIARLQRAIKGSGMRTITHEELLQKVLNPYWLENGLRRKVKNDPEEAPTIFLGYGFKWQTKHTQRAIEMIKNDAQDMGLDKDGDSTGGFYDPRGCQVSYGQTWLQGLDPFPSALWLPVKHTAGHSLICGTTGAGKTCFFILLICQAIFRKECVIILDPKGDNELCESARTACRLIGRESFFSCFDLAHPDQSVRINPLANFDDPSDIASRISTLIPGEDSAFKAFAWEVLQAISEGLVLSGESPTLTNLYAMVQGGTTGLTAKAIRTYAEQVDPLYSTHFQQRLELRIDRERVTVSGADIEKGRMPYQPEKTGSGAEAVEKLHRAIDAAAADQTAGVDPEIVSKYWVAYYRTFLADKHHNRAILSLISLYEHDREHLQKMITNLIPTLSSLTSGQAAPLLTPDEATADGRRILDLGKITEAGQVTYIGLNCLGNTVVGQAVGSIMLADLANVAARRYNEKSEAKRKNEEKNFPPVNLFVDECSEVVNGPFAQILNKGRGAGFRVYAATQTTPDFEHKLGSAPAMKQLLGNFNTIFAMRLKDTDSMKYIQDVIPLTRIKTVVRSQGTTTDSRQPLLATSNVGERLMEEESSILPFHLFAMLPNFEYFAIVAGSQILKCRFPMVANKHFVIDETKHRQYDGLLGRILKALGF